jgi:hypothetical protein
LRTNRCCCACRICFSFDPIAAPFNAKLTPESRG